MNHIDHETSTTIDGELLVWRRAEGWIWRNGDEGSIYFTERGDNWIGKKPRAIEPLAVGKSLKDCLMQVKKHYLIRRAQAHERMAAKLRAQANGYIR
jgi:hypothetical protein